MNAEDQQTEAEAPPPDPEPSSSSMPPVTAQIHSNNASSSTLVDPASSQQVAFLCYHAFFAYFSLSYVCTRVFNDKPRLSFL